MSEKYVLRFAAKKCNITATKTLHKIWSIITTCHRKYCTYLFSYPIYVTYTNKTYKYILLQHHIRAVPSFSQDVNFKFTFYIKHTSRASIQRIFCVISCSAEHFIYASSTLELSLSWCGARIYVFNIMCVCVCCMCHLWIMFLERARRIRREMLHGSEVCIWSWVEAEEVKCSFDVVVGYIWLFVECTKVMVMIEMTCSVFDFN